MFALTACSDESNVSDVSDIYARATAIAMLGQANARLTVDAQVSARKTALAPTLTPTHTPTRTPTPTHTSTFTPTPTPTITYTPTPDVLATIQFNATATKVALNTQAEVSAAVERADAVNRQRLITQLWEWAQFISAITFIIVIIILIMRVASQFITTMFLRRAVIETRSGTMIFIGSPSGGYTPTIVQPPPLQITNGSQSEAPDAHILVRQGSRQTFIPRTPDLSETERRLILRLLRESGRLNGWQSDIIPSANELGWSHDTRARAINLIRNYVVTREGRGGGTFVGDKHRTLYALYGDVGSRKVMFTPPLPTNQAQP